MAHLPGVGTDRKPAGAREAIRGTPRAGMVGWAAPEGAMRTRWLGGMLAACVLAFGGGDAAAQKTLRFVPQADLRILDPIWTTALITRNHGYMVFDTLFALDANQQPQPQMVERWSISADGLRYDFTLRDGLRFHDGQPVRPIDCIASLQRWGQRDVLGQKLMEVVASFEAIDDRNFAIKLKKPFRLLIDGLAKLSSHVPFIMPERLARTDADKQVTEMIGSGPVRFGRHRWLPGNKGGYRRNPDYVPRREPASCASVGKAVQV